MVFGLLVMFTALCISAVFDLLFLVAGLAAIFGPSYPHYYNGRCTRSPNYSSMVKHKYWKQAKWWLKYYPVTAVAVLMFITSVAFHYPFSKAHINKLLQV